MTGSFGYAGQSTFLDIIDEYITYDTIVSVQSIGIASRNYSEFSEYAPNIHSSNIFKKIQATYFSMKEIENIVWFEFNKLVSKPSKKPIISNFDYMTTDNITKQSENLLLSEFDPDQIKSLKSLDNKLSESSKTYFLLFSTSLPYDDRYFNNLVRILKNNQINHLMNRPFILSEVTKGDAEEHINPKFNCVTTKFFNNLINDQK
uniref:hypothetical protein n=2 Tax=Flavobacterium sp. TaxID=239 RepID=UPI00404B5C12